MGETERLDMQRARSVRLTLGCLITALVIGGVALIAALIAAQSDGVAGAIGIGVMVFLAAFAVGAALGFLFAVPRVLSEEGGAAQDPAQPIASDVEQDAAPAETAVSRRRRLLGSNTNLERISDWLTTMLVGVGLSQIGSVPGALGGFSDFLGSHCPSALVAAKRCTALPTIGPMVLIFGLVSGFLFLHLVMRLVIVIMLNDVERVIDGGIAVERLKIDDQDAKAATIQAAESLEGASENPTLRTLVASGQPSVEESLSVMNAHLYVDGGFQEVIDLGGKLSNSAAVRSPRYWVYMASAFGQKHHSLLEAKASSAEIRSARENALDCVRRAMAARPSYGEWLWRLSNPRAFDNDLQDFRKDPEFLAAIGRK